MQLNTTDFRRKCQHPLLLGVGSIPVALVVILNTVPELMNLAWLFLAAYVALSWACILLPGRKRLVGGLVSAALLAGMAFFLLPVTEKIALALLPVMYIVLLIVTLPIGGWSRNQELAIGWHVAGVVTHVLLQVLVSASLRTGEGVYGPAQMPVLVSFLAYVVLVLLALNRASLDSAAQSRRTVPLLMRRQNIVITLGLLVLGVLIAAVPAIGSALNTAWDFILRCISTAVGFLMTLMPQSAGGGGASGGGGDMSFEIGQTQEPSALAVILEKVIGVVALIAIIIAVVLLGRVLVKKLIKLFRYLWGRLGQYSAAASEDYEDEITSTRDEADTEREGLLARMRRFAPAEEKGRTPTERVRLRYKRLKQRHADWNQASTARETLPENAAELYERARYGGGTLSEEEAERFREGTRRV